MTVGKDDVPEGAWRQSDVATTPGVEVAFLGDRVVVRHAGDPDSAALVFPRAEWESFLAGLQRGEFDTP